MQRHCIWFDAPYKISVRAETIPAIAPNQVLVQTFVSAISAGTELLFYRGQVPPEMFVDSTIGALSGGTQYPLKYGYACVGRVIEMGNDISKDWHGRIVFAFQPHASHFAARLDELIPVTGDLTPEQAAFLPNMETAVNLVMDGTPILGERVVILGQGIVGLLTTRLLAQLPLAQLLTLDRFKLRREKSRLLGATDAFDPSDLRSINTASSLLTIDGADLTYELAGNPEALNLAIELTGFDGRIVIGSWYGQKRGTIDLGGKFHRSRIRLMSSQVSTIAPHFGGRWNKARRMSVVWTMLENFPASDLVTHRIPMSDAAHAYELLDQNPEQALQVLLTY